MHNHISGVGTLKNWKMVDWVSSLSRLCYEIPAENPQEGNTAQTCGGTEPETLSWAPSRPSKAQDLGSPRGAEQWHPPDRPREATEGTSPDAKTRSSRLNQMSHFSRFCFLEVRTGKDSSLPPSLHVRHLWADKASLPTACQEDRGQAAGAKVLRVWETKTKTSVHAANLV